MNALNILQVHYMKYVLPQRLRNFVYFSTMAFNVITFNKNCCEASSYLTGIAFLIIASVFFFCPPNETCNGQWEKGLVFSFTRPLYIAFIHHVPYLVHICQLFFGEATHAQSVFQDCAMQNFDLC
jgi:hypothetical protein